MLEEKTNSGLDPEIAAKVEARIIENHITIHKAGESLNDLLEKRATIKSYIETGFTEFDKQMYGGLYPGLYILGAISSMGKTAFISQMADQIAANKNDVLYFTLEMGAQELIARSLSRYSYLINDLKDRDAVTARRINSNFIFNNFEQKNFNAAIELYREEVANNLYYYESLGDIGAEEIRKEIERHINYKGSSPIVFIDYLQIMKPINENWPEKRNIDKAVIELRKIARDYNITIFAISSLNRGSYNGDIGPEAFKESGAIEYGSDVLLALQVPDLETGETPKDIKSNKEIIDREGQKEEKTIELKVIKNRSGRKGQRIKLKYNAKFNYFTDQDDENDVLKGFSDVTGVADIF